MAVTGYADLVEIGRGASAVVYRACQMAFDRPVALKVLVTSGLDDDARRRFDRECKVIGNLDWHPGVVPVYDAGVTGSGSPYLAMELLENGSFSKRLKDHGPLFEREVIGIAVRVADALEAAHQAGVLHRDVKPGNILVGRFGEAKLTDFGIASVSSAHTSDTNAVAGTLSYLAPELLNGGRASVASDVYSLGATLYSLLTASAAYARRTDDTPLALLMRITKESLPDLGAVGVSDRVAALVARSMAKEPADRFSSAAALGEAADAVASAHRWEATPTYTERPPRSACRRCGRWGRGSRLTRPQPLGSHRSAHFGIRGRTRKARSTIGREARPRSVGCQGGDHLGGSHLHDGQDPVT